MSQNIINEPASGGPVTGTTGDDSFVVNGVDAQFNGDGGVDTISFANAPATAAINVDLTTGTASGWGNYTLTGVTNIYGGPGGGTLRGGANTTYIAAPGSPGSTTTLIAGNADCQLVGGAGNDTFEGGPGNDYIVAGTGNNTIDGGGGFNTVSYANQTGFVSIDLYAGAWHPGGQDTIKNVSNVIGGNDGNILAANYQYSMTMTGGTGNDIFVPRNAGSGGTGAGITLTGGGGADTYVIPTDVGNVTITDFSGAAGDRIDLAAFGTFHTLADVSKVATQSGADTVLTLGTGEVVLKNTTIGSLTASDFQFSTADSFQNASLHTGASEAILENTNGAVDVGSLNSSNQFSYTQVASLGSEWSFDGTGDYLGDGQSQFLIQNTNGAIAVGDVGSSNATTFTAAGGVGAEWKIIGSGDLLGDGKDQFLVQNTNGALAVGQVTPGGGVTFTGTGGIGSEWAFEGVGDFLGDGKDQFLIDSSKSGGVYVGEVGANDQVTYTQIGGLGPGWNFEGVGNFLGGQKDEFLLQNTNGGLVVGTVSASGQATYQNIGGLGAEWKIIGVGDYNGYGVSDFLIQNTNGSIWTGSVQNNNAVYLPVSGVNSTWTFHG